MHYTDQFAYEIQLPNLNVDKSISFVTEIKVWQRSRIKAGQSIQWLNEKQQIG